MAKHQESQFRELHTGYLDVSGSILAWSFIANAASHSIAATLFVVANIALIIYKYYFSERFTKYPKPVADALRKAIYYSHYYSDPKRALLAWNLALQLCNEHNLDPFSMEVLGIRFEAAHWLEKIGVYDQALKAWDAVWNDCRRWVEYFDNGVKEGKTADPSARLLREEPVDQQKVPKAKADEEEEPLWAKRGRILALCCGCAVRLGQLYFDEHVMEPELAHEKLTWAVETILTELQRRKTEGVKPGEGSWIDTDEIGGAIEGTSTHVLSAIRVLYQRHRGCNALVSAQANIYLLALGHSYESRSQFDLAVPLFFEALKLCKDPCHIAILSKSSSLQFATRPL